jgi:hypothetical protein
MMGLQGEDGRGITIITIVIVAERRREEQGATRVPPSCKGRGKRPVLGFQIACGVGSLVGFGVDGIATV